MNTIDARELKLIIDEHHPFGHRVLLVSYRADEIRLEDICPGVIVTRTNFTSLHQYIIMEYDIVYSDIYRKVLLDYINENGLLILSFSYYKIHENGKLPKIDLMNELSDSMTCVYDSGIHTAWKEGRNPWEIPNKNVKVESIQGEPPMKIVTHRTVGRVYQKDKNWIKEMGTTVRSSEWFKNHWFDNAESITSAYYKRLLGPGKLELRNTDRPLYIPGIISIPRFGNKLRFRNISDPYI